MAISRRRAIALTAGAFAASGLPATAQTGDWPSRPLRVIVGFPAGSGADILCRWFARKLEEVSGQTVVVENRPGATANIAAGTVAKSKPDGYTILFAANSNMAGSRFLFKDLGFDTIKDFDPVGLFSDSAFVLTVAPQSPVKSVAELTELLRAKPRSLYGYANQMSLVTSEYYKTLTGLKTAPVAYKNGPDAVADLASGALDFIILDGTFASGQVRAGRLRALAVTTAERLASMPDVPTMQEAGLKGFVFSAWWGAYLPAGTPAPIVEKLAGWLNQASSGEDARKFMESIAGFVLRDGPAATRARLNAELEVWAKIVAAAGLKPE